MRLPDPVQRPQEEEREPPEWTPELVAKSKRVLLPGRQREV